MPLKCPYQRKDGSNQRDQWSEETQQEAVNRKQAAEIERREAERYYGVSAITSCCRFAIADFKKTGFGPHDAVRQGNRKLFARYVQ
jgi:hypothetical protein